MRQKALQSKDQKNSTKIGNLKVPALVLERCQDKDKGKDCYTVKCNY